MVSVKELKSIDLASYTIISTALSVLIAILLSIGIALGILILIPQASEIVIYLIPTLVVGTFMVGIYRYFSEGLFYNLLATRLRNIKIELDGGEITKISPTETATLVATIALIQAILIYLVSVLLLPLFFSALMQTVMLSNQALAYSLYQILLLLSQPMTVLMFIFGTFVITFIFVLIGVYIYNVLASKGRGIVLGLSEENGLTAIDSIDMMKFAIVIAVISGVLSLITGIISLISGGNAITLISNVIISIISGFVAAALIAIFYNYLAPKIGKIKIELIDA
ncbi:hypothetical protein [Methanobrevibacter sp.]|uniref:hypothetical protein n=1 Tax=Methanobrevibacter sp. TaxID=66852 RepID=UPI003890C05C